MADIFDKMKAGINKGVATISTGSKTVVEKTKINSIIHNLDEEKKRLCEMMGIKIFEFCAENPGTDFPCEEMGSFCAQIVQCNLQIEEQKKKLAELDIEMNRVLGTQTLQEGKVCKCGYTNINGARFCAKCGSSLE